MPNRPTTRYTTTPDGTSIAYQVLGGTGPFVVLLRAWITNLELEWEEPVLASVMRRIAGFGRLVLLDRRGMGLSDRVGSDAPLSERTDDIVAVLDAVGADRASLVGLAAADALVAMFAAAQPERTDRLVLFHPEVGDPAPGNPDPELDIERWAQEWGSVEHAAVIAAQLAPTRADDEAFLRWLAAEERQGCSPTLALRTMQWLDTLEVSDLYRKVTAPTLVLARRSDLGDYEKAAEDARMLPDATLVEIPGGDHMLISGPVDQAVDEIERFLTGAVRTAPDADRVVTTVMFTDLVSSTELLTARGDRAWSQLVAEHHAVIRALLAQYGGVEQDTAGDGFFATFPSPARALRGGMEIRRRLALLGLNVRIGIHTGEVDTAGSQVSGVAVVMAARVMATAGAGQIHVTATVRDLVEGAGFAFDDLGDHALKGIPGPRRLYALTP